MYSSELETLSCCNPPTRPFPTSAKFGSLDLRVAKPSVFDLSAYNFRSLIYIFKFAVRV